MSFSIPYMIVPLTVPELKTMSEQFGFNSRLLSEAQEVMLFNGFNPAKVREELPRLCEDARGQGGSVEIFRKLLIAIVNHR